MMSRWAGFGARALLGLIGLAACTAAWGQQPTVKTGPEVGSTVPPFEALDQNSQLRSFANIAGPQGAMLVFFRSADW